MRADDWQPLMDGSEGSAAAASVIVVTYNSASTIEGCLRSVPPQAELIVVDQCSRDQTVALVHAASPRAKVVLASANRGFGAGCNLGAAQATRGTLIFLNPDARMAVGCVEGLVDTLRNEFVGLAGPQIVDPSGEWQTYCRRRGGPFRDVANLCVSQRLLPVAWRSDIPRTDLVYAAGGAVPYIQGCCMAIRREVFASVAGFDEDFFLYSEEEFLADRLARLDLKVYLVADAEVVHIGGHSTGPTAHFATVHFFRSRALLYRRRYGRFLGFGASVLLAAALVGLYVTAVPRRRLGLRAEQDGAWCAAALHGIWASRGPAIAPADSTQS